MSRTEDNYPVDIYSRADDYIEIAAEVLNEHDGSIPLVRYRETSANKGQ